MTRLLSAVMTTMAVMLFAGGAALAQPTVRAGTIPGLDVAGLTPTGDLWTFKCPRDGTFTISVDTAEDTSNGESLVDPQILVHDGAGNQIAGADDNQACSHAPVCGFACPAVNNISCGTGSVHSVSVASASNESDGCPGGTYYLSVAIQDRLKTDSRLEATP